MKKIFLTLFLAIILLPWPATAQTWVEPVVQPDGTVTPGHWSTTADGWQKSFATPGTMNPFTGQFNRYGKKNSVTSSVPGLTPPPGAGAPDPYPAKNPVTTATRAYSSPVPGSADPNPHLIPGSNALNPYTVLRSTPNKPVKQEATGNPQLPSQTR